jgi:monoterpene epsilon-lactone hydrolase
MISNETAKVRAMWTDLLNALAPPAGIPEYRERWDDFCAGFSIPPDTVIEDVDAGGVPALLVRAASAASDNTVLWAHSGGYVFGSVTSYRAFAARLSAAADSQVLLVDYRLAPESLFPAAHDDVNTAYRYLLGQGRSGSSIVLGGDSAGGGLIAGSLLRLKDEGLVLPAGVMVVSPFTDFTFSGESMTERADIDPIGSRAMLEGLGGLYRGETPVDEPYISPIFGDWKGAPPLLALVGSEEVLFDDSVRLVAAVRAAGGEARLVVGEGQAHIWHIFRDVLPEAEEAISTLGSFARESTRVTA